MERAWALDPDGPFKCLLFLVTAYVTVSAFHTVF